MSDEMDVGCDLGATRHLPSHLPVEISRSMRADPITAVNEGPSQLKKILLTGLSCVEMAWISIMTLGREEVQIIPLTELLGYEPATLEPGGWSRRSATFCFLTRVLGREIISTSLNGRASSSPPRFDRLFSGRPRRRA